MGKFQWFPDQASTIAPKIDALYFYELAVTVFFTALIALLVGFFAIKYRRQHPDERPTETHTSKLLEITWIVIPLILTMIMFGWGAWIWIDYSKPPQAAMEIQVVGKQWMWKIQHPDGQREINCLHVPVGKPIKLTLTSQDVIHDFGIPAFRTKIDVIPGRYTTCWFEATKPGEYHLFCDQFCGTEHSRMRGSVVVMTPENYQAWLSGQVPGLSPVEAGKVLFQQYSCNACHSQNAPTLAGLYKTKVKVWQDGKLKEVTADDDYLQRSIVNASEQIVDGYGTTGNGVNMPTFKGVLSDEQVMQLVAYIKSLSDPDQKADDWKMRNRYVPPEPSTPDDLNNTK